MERGNLRRDGSGGKSQVFVRETKTRIGLLDIFGFEAFENNSFEQLCINFCNEKLQQFFVRILFKLEVTLYKTERLRTDKMEFRDNQACVDLLEKKPNGIFALLQDELRVPKGSDEGFLAKCNQAHGKDANYDAVKAARPEFIVKHYAQPVVYNVTGFLSKTQNALSDDVSTLFNASKMDMMRDFFKDFKANSAEKMGSMRRRSTVRSGVTSVGSLFQQSLAELLLEIQKTNSHFVRCIKPNNAKAAASFDSTMVMRQLQTSGVMDAVSIRKLGYSDRLTHREFLQRYWFVHTLPPQARTAKRAAPFFSYPFLQPPSILRLTAPPSASSSSSATPLPRNNSSGSLASLANSGGGATSSAPVVLTQREKDLMRMCRDLLDQLDVTKQWQSEGEKEMEPWQIGDMRIFWKPAVGGELEGKRLLLRTLYAMRIQKIVRGNLTRRRVRALTNAQKQLRNSVLALDLNAIDAALAEAQKCGIPARIIKKAQEDRHHISQLLTVRDMVITSLSSTAAVTSLSDRSSLMRQAVERGRNVPLENPTFSLNGQAKVLLEQLLVCSRALTALAGVFEKFWNEIRIRLNEANANKEGAQKVLDLIHGSGVVAQLRIPISMMQSYGGGGASSPSSGVSPASSPSQRRPSSYSNGGGGGKGGGGQRINWLDFAQVEHDVIGKLKDMSEVQKAESRVKLLEGLAVQLQAAVQHRDLEALDRLLDQCSAPSDNSSRVGSPNHNNNNAAGHNNHHSSAAVGGGMVWPQVHSARCCARALLITRQVLAVVGGRDMPKIKEVLDSLQQQPFSEDEIDVFMNAPLATMQEAREALKKRMEQIKTEGLIYKQLKEAIDSHQTDKINAALQHAEQVIAARDATLHAKDSRNEEAERVLVTLVDEGKRLVGSLNATQSARSQLKALNERDSAEHITAVIKLAKQANLSAEEISGAELLLDECECRRRLQSALDTHDTPELISAISFLEKKITGHRKDRMTKSTVTLVEQAKSSLHEWTWVDKLNDIQRKLDSAKTPSEVEGAERDLKQTYESALRNGISISVLTPVQTRLAAIDKQHQQQQQLKQQQQSGSRPSPSLGPVNSPPLIVKPTVVSSSRPGGAVNVMDILQGGDAPKPSVNVLQLMNRAGSPPQSRPGGAINVLSAMAPISSSSSSSSASSSSSPPQSTVYMGVSSRRDLPSDQVEIVRLPDGFDDEDEDDPDLPPVVVLSHGAAAAAAPSSSSSSSPSPSSPPLLQPSPAHAHAAHTTPVVSLTPTLNRPSDTTNIVHGVLVDYDFSALTSDGDVDKNHGAAVRDEIVIKRQPSEVLIQQQQDDELKYLKNQQQRASLLSQQRAPNTSMSSTVSTASTSSTSSTTTSGSSATTTTSSSARRQTNASSASTASSSSASSSAPPSPSLKPLSSPSSANLNAPNTLAGVGSGKIKQSPSPGGTQNGGSSHHKPTPSAPPTPTLTGKTGPQVSPMGGSQGRAASPNRTGTLHHPDGSVSGGGGVASGVPAGAAGGEGQVGPDGKPCLIM